jgi:hypothetical protein
MDFNQPLFLKFIEFLSGKPRNEKIYYTYGEAWYIMNCLGKSNFFKEREFYE